MMRLCRSVGIVARLRWSGSLAVYGDVPATDLDSISDEFFRKAEQRYRDCALPPVTHLPSFTTEKEAVAEVTDLSDADCPSPHIPIESTTTDIAVPPRPSLVRLRHLLVKKRQSSSKKPKNQRGEQDDALARVPEYLPKGDGYDDLRKLLHRTAVAGQLTSVNAPPTPASVRIAPEPPLGRKMGRLAALKRQLDAPRAVEASTTLTAATAVLLPVTRLTSHDMTTDEHVDARRARDMAESDVRDDEKRTLAPSDALSQWTFDERLKERVLLFYKMHPVNHMIHAEHVRIGAVLNKSTGEMDRIPDAEQETMTAHRARRLAAEMGLDLVKFITLDHTKNSVLCMITDANRMLMDSLQVGAQISTEAAWVRETLEVGFTGGICSWMTLVKAREIAKLLHKRYPIRIVLRRFGTAREGFPVFDCILATIRDETAQRRVYYRTSKVWCERDSICCLLQPSTLKVPLSQTIHPSEAELKQAMDAAMYEEQFDREVVLPREIRGANEQKHFHWMQRKGLAWTYRSPGLTLRKQRQLKVFQGWFPKGNKKLYSARGDVDLTMGKKHFRKFGPAAQNHAYPKENNLEKAQRGAAVLGLRARMDVSDLVDQNETEGETSTIANMRYNMWGDVLAMGRMKETLGWKWNRKRTPAYAPLPVPKQDRPE